MLEEKQITFSHQRGEKILAQSLSIRILVKTDQIRITCWKYNLIGFISSYKIAVIYDKNWRAKFGTEGESVLAALRAIAQAQLIFRWPTLTVPITLVVASITFQNIDIPANVAGL